MTNITPLIEQIDELEKKATPGHWGLSGSPLRAMDSMAMLPKMRKP